MSIASYPCSYLSPKLAGRTRCDGERGVFACEAIAHDELIAVWGGKIVDYATLINLHPLLRKLSLQVEEHLYLVSTVESASDWVNHSSAPNAGLRGQISLVAIRAILPGEEVTFDYAMCDSSAYDEFDCLCGATTCRQQITGKDWQLPALQPRYRGYFSAYLQARIEHQPMGGHRNGFKG